MRARAWFAALVWVAAAAAPLPLVADFRLIDFEAGKFVNLVGDMNGSWRNGGGSVRMSVNREADQGQALRFDYNVSSGGQDAGHWFAFRHFDMRPYESVRLKVRGRNGGEIMAFGFKDDRWYEERISIVKYLEGGISKEWQSVTIPLKDFAKVRQWDSMDNYSISFSNSKNELPRSEVYVKDIELVLLQDKKNTWFLTKEDRMSFPIPFDAGEASEEQLLDLVERSAFGFFWNEANPANGLIKDRCYAFGPDQRRVASIASVGFGLSAICVADKRGWIPREEAYQRVLTTLKFFRDHAQKYNGFFFHYYEMDTGAPVYGCEISSIDTGLLLMGVVTARQYFAGTEVETVAKDLIEEANWTWMCNEDRFLSMAWHPGNNFEKAQWKDYNEGILLYFLAASSPTYPVSAEAWKHIDRETFKFKEREFTVASGQNSLFEHQYPQVWLDLNGWADKKKIDYFANSAEATYANYEWCMDNTSKYKTFGEGFWGLTACDGPSGYVVNGAPYGACDGTVAPTAPLASIAFAPKLSMEQLRKYFQYKDRIWGKYGLVDSFNLDKDWFSSVHLGIDQGPIVLMIENYRTGMIWDLVSKDPMIQEAYKKLGFERGPATAVAKVQPPEAAETN
jgi:hypothetical protein